MTKGEDAGEVLAQTPEVTAGWEQEAALRLAETGEQTSPTH